MKERKCSNALAWQLTEKYSLVTPPKIEPMVRSIIESFKNHTRDSVPVWMEKQEKPFLVTYYAVRDKKDNYLGTVEVVQDMQFAKEHFTSKTHKTIDCNRIKREIFYEVSDKTDTSMR